MPQARGVAFVCQPLHAAARQSSLWVIPLIELQLAFKIKTIISSAVHHAKIYHVEVYSMIRSAAHGLLRGPAASGPTGRRQNLIV